MAAQEGWSFEQALARCAAEDRARDRFTRYFFGDAPLRPAAYHAVFNTAWGPLPDVVACVVALLRPEGAGEQRGTGRRVLTLSRELGAGEKSFAPALAARLKLQVYDRELLEQEAIRLGVTQAELEKVDEQPAGLFRRLRPGGLPHRYFEVLGQLMSELASRGDVLLVGRGGNRLLREDPRAFHARVVAPTLDRVRRVMEHRWLRESAARQLITDSDARRCRYYADSFGADWSDPLEYHLIANTGRLGPAAVDLVAWAAERHWSGGSG
jgi:cytidylate kinase